jgi:hypothetical protein
VDDLDTLIERILERSGEALSPSAVRKALPVGSRLPLQQLHVRLQSLVEAGRIFRWRGKSARFSTVAPETLAQEQVIKALSAGPLAEADIKKNVPAASRPLVSSSIGSLERDGRILRHPKLGRRQPFGLNPPDPFDYLRPELDALLLRLQKAGIPAIGLRQALQRYVEGAEESRVGTGDEDALLSAMHRLNPQVSRGAMVYLADLRASLQSQFPDKASFDQAVVRLAELGRVQLQSHAWPGRLTDAEKRALVENGRGGYFDAIGIRM